jgi:homocysteine S-methyltransferase
MDDAAFRHRLRHPRPVVLDGGLGTTLAANGHPLRDALWSARLLLDSPDAIREVHAAFVAAGAEVVTTSSYQLAARSLDAAGRDPGLAPMLLRRSVELAREGIALAAETRPGTIEGGREVLVAASVGPYGAALADGSEYRGHYGLSVEELLAFHAPRVEALLAASPDVLAFETVPSADEVAAIARLLEGTGLSAWISVTVGAEGTTTAEGQPLAEALAPALALDEVVAVGVNCCPPSLIGPALRTLAGCGRPIVVYPNIGRRWDAQRRRWTELGARGDHAPAAWVADGARLVGGCCGTGPDDITRLAAELA